jgi:hypothetical protein
MRHRSCVSARLRVATAWVAVLATAAVALAGCGKPGGVDGTLTDDWRPVSAPTGFTPPSGTCHLASFVEMITREAYEDIDCALQHRTETVYVGTYPKVAAEAPQPPADGSAGAREAYRQCDLKTTAYVGAHWRTGRLWIGVTHPTAAAWTGGARWFRCEVVEVASIEDDGDLLLRVGSLRNALKAPDSPLRLTCYAIKLDATGAINTMPVARCATPHNAEFVGVWYAGDLAYPKQDVQWKRFHTGCRRLLASYVGVPVNPDLEFRAGVVSLPGGADVWAAGDHAVRCYLWLDSATLTSSLKGKGAKALPVQYE